MNPLSAMVQARGDVEAARRGFAEAGFEVGPEVGGTFAITAPQDRFERMFGKSGKESGGGKSASKSKAAAKAAAVPDPLVLPTGGLPEALRRHVALVTFSAPLDFGPTNY